MEQGVDEVVQPLVVLELPELDQGIVPWKLDGARRGGGGGGGGEGGFFAKYQRENRGVGPSQESEERGTLGESFGLTNRGKLQGVE